MNQQPRQVRIGVELTPNMTMDDLRTTLHNDTGIDRDHIIMAEINEMGKYIAWPYIDYILNFSNYKELSEECVSFINLSLIILLCLISINVRNFRLV